jgi:hypothetical protein
MRTSNASYDVLAYAMIDLLYEMPEMGVYK